MDNNGDGFLTHDEVKEAMKKCKQPMSDKAIREMIEAADEDNDGKVNYSGKASFLVTIEEAIVVKNFNHSLISSVCGLMILV